jgi:hypothetical protein
MQYQVYFNWDNASEVSRELVEQVIARCDGIVSYREVTAHNLLEPDNLKYNLTTTEVEDDQPHVAGALGFDAKILEEEFVKACGGYGFLTVWRMREAQVRLKHKHKQN